VGSIIEFRYSDPSKEILAEYNVENPALFILPDTVAIAQAREAIVNVHGIFDGSMFTTFEKFAERIVTASERKKPILLSDASLDIIAREIATDIYGGERELEAHHLLRDFQSIEGLLLSDRDRFLNSIEGNADRHFIDFSLKMEERLQTFRETGIFDRVTLILRASEIVDEGSVSLPADITAAFFIYLDETLMRLTKALSGRCRMRFIFAEESRGTSTVRRMEEKLNPEVSAANSAVSLKELDFFSAPDRRREVWEVARRVADSLTGGMDAEKIAIVAPAISAYQPYLEEVLGEAGIRFRGGGRTNFTSTRLYSLIEHVLHAIQDRKWMERLVLHDLFWDNQSSRNDSRSVTDTGHDLPVLPASRERMNVTEWAEYVSRIIDHVQSSRLEDKESEYLDFIRRRIREEVLVLNVLYSSDSLGGGEFNAYEFSKLLSVISENISIPSSYHSNGIYVTDAGLLYFMHRKLTFAIGMDEKFPSPKREGMFLSMRLLDELYRNGMLPETSTEIIDCREREQFNRVLRETEKVIFSHTYLGNERERLIPSKFVLEMAGKQGEAHDLIQKIFSNEIGISEFFSGERHPLFPAEMERFLALGKQDALLNDRLGEEMAARLYSAAAFADRENRVWRFSNESIRSRLEQRVISASDLNEYAKCPFRFVALRIMKTHKREEPFSKLTEGRDMHEILSRFYSKHSLEYLRSLNGEDLSRLVSEETDRFTGEHYASVERPPFFYFDRLRERLKNFVIKDMEMERRLSGEILDTEMSFGEENFSIGEHRFHGRMDRVETIDSQGRILLYDYKNNEELNHLYVTGRMDSIKDYELPLYALCLRHLYGERLSAALYYSITERSGDTSLRGFIRSEVRPFFDRLKRKRVDVLDGDAWSATLESYSSIIEETASRMKRCLFPLTENPAICRNCSFEFLCMRSEENGE